MHSFILLSGGAAAPRDTYLPSEPPPSQAHMKAPQTGLLKLIILIKVLVLEHLKDKCTIQTVIVRDGSRVGGMIVGLVG